MAITKAFTIHESIVTKFRMDAFNAFNHITAGNPGGDMEGRSAPSVVKVAVAAPATIADRVSLSSLFAFSSKA